MLFDPISCLSFWFILWINNLQVFISSHSRWSNKLFLPFMPSIYKVRRIYLIPFGWLTLQIQIIWSTIQMLYISGQHIQIANGNAFILSLRLELWGFPLIIFFSLDLFANLIFVGQLIDNNCKIIFIMMAVCKIKHWEKW